MQSLKIEASLEINLENSTLKSSKLLAEQNGLSQVQIKEAMQKGAVWLLRGKTKKRLRRAGKSLRPGDTLQLNYNSDILNQTVPIPQLLHDAGEYSVWFKPYGMACQGSRWGDFASLPRWVETHLSELTDKPQRPAHLVHRLDRATSGLILLAHSKNAARSFSQMFAAGDVDKRYQAIVWGDFSEFPKKFKVSKKVDGKDSTSVFSFNECKDDKSLLDVELKTGRKHQIRKHLSSLGYPIVGDRLYGNEKEFILDLQLQSISLNFVCPYSNQMMNFQLKGSKRMQLN